MKHALQTLLKLREEGALARVAIGGANVIAGTWPMQILLA